MIVKLKSQSILTGILCLLLTGTVFAESAQAPTRTKHGDITLKRGLTESADPAEDKIAHEATHTVQQKPGQTKTSRESLKSEPVEIQKQPR